jgi:hypothetical protein
LLLEGMSIVDPVEHADLWTWSQFRDNPASASDQVERSKQAQRLIEHALDSGIAIGATDAPGRRLPDSVRPVPEPLRSVSAGTGPRSTFPVVATWFCSDDWVAHAGLAALSDAGAVRLVALDQVAPSMRIPLLRRARVLVDQPGFGGLSWAGLEALRSGLVVAARCESLPRGVLDAASDQFVDAGEQLNEILMADPLSFRPEQPTEAASWVERTHGNGAVVRAVLDLLGLVHGA